MRSGAMPLLPPLLVALVWAWVHTVLLPQQGWQPVVLVCALIPAITLSVLGGILDASLVVRCRSLRLLGLVGGCVLVFHFPPFFERMFLLPQYPLDSSLVVITRLLASGLFVGATLGACIVLVMGLVEFAIKWCFQWQGDTYGYFLPSLRLIGFLLLLALVLERSMLLIVDLPGVW